MAAQNRGLGKGIGALIPNVTAPEKSEKNAPKPTQIDETVQSAVYSEIEIGRITPNPRQPRSEIGRAHV